MTRIVALLSGKGGVGKTTFAVNAGSLFSAFGRDVLVVDGDLATPTIGIHIGTHEYPVTLHDVFLGKGTMKDAIYYHHTSGLKFIPGHISLHKSRLVFPRLLRNLKESLEGLSPVVFLDCPSGTGEDVASAIAASHDAIAITTPDLPAVLATLKTLTLAREQGTLVRGVIVNKAYGIPHELSTRDIEAMLETKVMGTVPHDSRTIEALRMRQPITTSHPESPAAQAFKNIVESLAR